MKLKHIMTFVMVGQPETATAQQKGVTIRNGYIHFYEKKNIADAKARIKDELLRFVPDNKIECPVSLSIHFLFGTRNKKQQFTPRVTRPDVDNMAKGFIDCMTELGFWDDDNLITHLDISKSWVDPERAGTVVEISEITDMLGDVVL